MSGGPDACWPWTTTIGNDGYGQYQLGGHTKRAHRIAWELARGPILNGMSVLHYCDSPSCVNPSHLFLGTQADNMRDMCEKGRQARGDSNGARMHPDRAPRGERHGSQTHPERVPRGNRSGARTHPETRPRGEQNGNARLTAADVVSIRSIGKNVSQCGLGATYGVSQGCISQILRGLTWVHVASETA